MSLDIRTHCEIITTMKVINTSIETNLVWKSSVDQKDKISLNIKAPQNTQNSK